MSYAVEGCVATVLAVLAAAWLLWPWGELAVPTIEPVDPEQARPGWQGKLRPDPAPPVVAHPQNVYEVSKLGQCTALLALPSFIEVRRPFAAQTCC